MLGEHAVPCFDSLRNGMEKYTIFGRFNRDLKFSIRKWDMPFLYKQELES
jgi:hypothetical protein